MSAIPLALVGGVFLGALSVTVRAALRRAPNLGASSVLLNAGSFVVALIVAAIAGGLGDLDLGGLWPFLVIGFVIPGLTQILWVGAVGAAGASRTQVVLATSPLTAVLLAVVLLDESLNAALLAGTLLVVAGAVALAWERERPVDFRAIGIALAASVALIAGGRDVATRWALTDTETATGVAPAATLLAATVAALLLSLVRKDTRFGWSTLKRSTPAFAPSILIMAGAYITIFAAFERGDVTVVSPLVGTFGLWAVIISAIVLPKAEAVGARLVVSAVLIVGGVTLVTAFQESDSAPSIDTAVEEFRELPTEIADPTGRGPEPQPGVYVYATRGGESIDFLLGTTHTYPDETPLTVRLTPCGYSETWLALNERTTERDFCVGEEGLTLTSYAERHRFVGQTDLREYVCDDPGIYLPVDAQVGETWSLSCTAGDTIERWQGTLESIDSLLVDGEPQAVAEIQFDTTLDGATVGSSSKRVWVRVEDNLLIREIVENDNVTASPLGDVRYQESYEVELDGLEPLR